jgi:hypothetical protein
VPRPSYDRELPLVAAGRGGACLASAGLLSDLATTIPLMLLRDEATVAGLRSLLDHDLVVGAWRPNDARMSLVTFVKRLAQVGRAVDECEEIHRPRVVQRPGDVHKRLQQVSRCTAVTQQTGCGDRGAVQTRRERLPTSVAPLSTRGLM